MRGQSDWSPERYVPDTMDIRKVFEETAGRYPKKPALIFKESEISFAELHTATRRLAGALRELGIGRGDRVALYLPNCPEYVLGYLACFHLGAVAVPLDYMLKSDELVSCLEHSETKLLIAKENTKV